MISQKQLEANRRNAQKSTGPKSPEGKAKSAQNSLRHGLLAKTVVADTEDRDAFEQLLTDLNEHYQPVGPMETIHVEKIAFCYWRMMRCSSHEAGLIEHKQAVLEKEFNEDHKTDEQIDKELQALETKLPGLKETLSLLKEFSLSSAPLSELYIEEYEDSWRWAYEHYLRNSQGLWAQIDIERAIEAVTGVFSDKRPITEVAKAVHETMNECGYSDEQITEIMIERQYDEYHQAISNVQELIEEQKLNRRSLTALRRVHMLPSGKELDLICRYGTANEKQMVQAIRMLERSQKDRAKTQEIVPEQPEPALEYSAELML